MSADRNAQRIVLAGASSLLGGEVKSLLEESRFAGWDLRLVDEDEAAGVLTEVAGAAGFIQKVDEDTFRGARFAFLAGSHRFGMQCLKPARESGATVIDFSHAAMSDPDGVPWFSRIEALSGRVVWKKSPVFGVCSAAGAAIASLTLQLRRYDLQRLVAMVYEPVSEAGRDGVEELETQTSQLLSFQSVGHRVFGTQTAFNMLPRFGTESRVALQEKLLELRGEISASLGDPAEDVKIAVNLVHAPVFYGTAFSVCVDVSNSVDATGLSQTLREAGFLVIPSEEAGPSNVSVAGDSKLYLREPQPDTTRENCWWFWGAGDNLRVPAASGIKLAEWLDS
jgi:aspartate-semialdehyde dehydrogenase